MGLCSHALAGEASFSRLKGLSPFDAREHSLHALAGEVTFSRLKRLSPFDAREQSSRALAGEVTLSLSRLKGNRVPLIHGNKVPMH